jgi:hypothetical protein
LVWEPDRHGPFKGSGVLVVSRDEGVDLLDELFHGAEAGSAKRLGREDAEPDFDLIEPRGVRWGEVKVNLGVRQVAYF